MNYGAYLKLLETQVLLEISIFQQENIIGELDQNIAYSVVTGHPTTPLHVSEIIFHLV